MLLRQRLPKSVDLVTRVSELGPVVVRLLRGGGRVVDGRLPRELVLELRDAPGPSDELAFAPCDLCGEVVELSPETRGFFDRALIDDDPRRRRKRCDGLEDSAAVRHALSRLFQCGDELLH